jgi:hypothetical protein
MKAEASAFKKSGMIFLKKSITLILISNQQFKKL